jgi:hypothetical protein
VLYRHSVKQLDHTVSFSLLESPKRYADHEKSMESQITKNEQLLVDE